MDLKAALELHRSNRLPEAEQAYRAIIAREPTNATAIHLLGMLAQHAGRSGEAVELLKRAVELSPTAAELHHNLAAVVGLLGRHGEAVTHGRAAVQLKPAWAEAHHNLGVALEHSGHGEESLTAYRQAIALRPDYVEAHHHLGNALRRAGYLDESVESHRRALDLRPNFVEAYRGLASTYSEIGNQQEVIACRRKVVEFDPVSSVAHSDLLLALHYPAGISQESLFEEACRWEQRHARHLYPANPPPRRAIEGSRPLRIGYVSADFREHPVARLMLPLLAAHDPRQFQTHCYSDTRSPDEITTQLRSRAQIWRDTAALSDEQLAQQIATDQIDILVDLGGHMGGNRLLVFARKPAPVQVTMFNYPDTTGLATMDYRITDVHSDPPGADRLYTEKLVRLPDCAWCYDPGETPTVGPPPLLRNGYVTFGCLNNPLKVGPEVVEVWSRILRAVPGSRLMMLGADAKGSNSYFASLFAEQDIGPDRLTFVRRQSRRAYLEQFNEIDIALDPFPYNGGVTSCDALWMGVPLVTLVGETYRGRQGAMLLRNAGLQEVTGLKEYAEAAIRLREASDNLQHFGSRVREKLTDAQNAVPGAMTDAFWRMPP